MAIISFARGVPAPECLPSELLADCAAEALRRDGRTILSYGPSPGYGPLREQLAERHAVDPSRIFLTNGSLQGFVFLAQRLAPGKRVLVERPTYDRPLKILRELGADVVGLQEVDARGRRFQNMLARRLGYDPKLRHPGEALMKEYEEITEGVRGVYERILGEDTDKDGGIS